VEALASNKIFLQKSGGAAGLQANELLSAFGLRRLLLGLALTTLGVLHTIEIRCTQPHNFLGAEMPTQVGF
jgi:hypothetical protein